MIAATGCLRMRRGIKRKSRSETPRASGRWYHNFKYLLRPLTASILTVIRHTKLTITNTYTFLNISLYVTIYIDKKQKRTHEPQYSKFIDTVKSAGITLSNGTQYDILSMS